MLKSINCHKAACAQCTHSEAVITIYLAVQFCQFFFVCFSKYRVNGIFTIFYKFAVNGAYYFEILGKGIDSFFFFFMSKGSKDKRLNKI